MATHDPQLLRCCLDTIKSVYKGEVPADGVIIGCDHCSDYMQYAECHWYWLEGNWQAMRAAMHRLDDVRRVNVEKLLEVHGVLYEAEKARLIKAERGE